MPFNPHFEYLQAKIEIDQKYKEVRDMVGKYKPLSTEDSAKLDSLMIKWIEEVSSSGKFFLHCQIGVQVADISPSKGAGADDSFIKSLTHFRTLAKLVTSKTDTHPTILYGESFGSNTSTSQRDELLRLLENQYSISTSTYNSGNSHVELK